RCRSRTVREAPPSSRRVGSPLPLPFFSPRCCAGLLAGHSSCIRSQGGRSVLGLFRLLGRGVIYFDACPILQCAKSLVTPGDDLVTLLQTAGNLDIRRAGNTRSHWYENRILFVLQDENAGQLFLGVIFPLFVLHTGLDDLVLLFVFLVFQILPLAYGKRLDRNGQHPVSRRSGDSGRSR